jgi:hypothetical protein
VNGQRLFEADFFSLVMLTTLGWTFRTASTTGVRRALTAASRGGVESDARPDERMAIPISAIVPTRPHPRRFKGSGTAVVPNLGLARHDIQARRDRSLPTCSGIGSPDYRLESRRLNPTQLA